MHNIIIFISNFGTPHFIHTIPFIVSEAMLLDLIIEEGPNTGGGAGAVWVMSGIKQVVLSSETTTRERNSFADIDLRIPIDDADVFSILFLSKAKVEAVEIFDDK